MSQIQTLVASARSRLEQVQREGNRLQAKIVGHEREIRELRERLNHVAAEFRLLSEVVEAYTKEQPEQAAPQSTDELPGVTEAIVALLAGQPDHTMAYLDLLDRLEKDINAKRVKTTSDDPRKLVSSTVSVLVGRGKLHRNGAGQVSLVQASK